MSICIWPERGQHIVSGYYRNGNDVELYQCEAPQMGLCSSNAAALFDAVGVPYGDDEVCGSIPFASINIVIARTEGLGGVLRERYYSQFMEVLCCAKYHECDVCFG